MHALRQCPSRARFWPAWLTLLRLQKPIYVTLIPFATFSLFHTRAQRETFEPEADFGLTDYPFPWLQSPSCERLSFPSLPWHQLEPQKALHLPRRAQPSFPRRSKCVLSEPIRAIQALTRSVSQTWVKAHYEQAMLFVSFVEVVVVFGRVLLGAITFQNS